MDLVNVLWVRSLGRGYDAMTNIFTVKSSGGGGAGTAIDGGNSPKGNRGTAEGQSRVVGLRGVRHVHAHPPLPDRLRDVPAGERGTLAGVALLLPIHVLPHRDAAGDAQQYDAALERTDGQSAAGGRTVSTTGHDPKQARCPPLERVRGTITFDHVSFTYGDADTLQDITLEVEPGEHIALVGHSGAGKSTIAMLLNRFYDVSGGRCSSMTPTFATWTCSGGGNRWGS
jgi:ABC-type multidrug transport system fused ATPase/permease subunit